RHRGPEPRLLDIVDQLAARPDARRIGLVHALTKLGPQTVGQHTGRGMRVHWRNTVAGCDDLCGSTSGECAGTGGQLCLRVWWWSVGWVRNFVAASTSARFVRWDDGGGTGSRAGAGGGGRAAGDGVRPGLGGRAGGPADLVQQRQRHLVV